MKVNMLREVVERSVIFLDYFSRGTIFLAFTFYPSLIKAICSSNKVHLQHFRQLLAQEYNRKNYLNSYFALKERVLAWLNEILFLHLIAAKRLVDKWSIALNRMRQKTRQDLDGESTKTRKSILDENVESMPIPLVIRRTSRGSFVDVSLPQFIKLQLHYSKLQYAVLWVLYQMIYRPPLAFLYLMNTILNELSFFIFSDYHHYKESVPIGPPWFSVRPPRPSVRPPRPSVPPPRPPVRPPRPSIRPPRPPVRPPRPSFYPPRSSVSPDRSPVGSPGSLVGSRGSPAGSTGSPAGSPGSPVSESSSYVYHGRPLPRRKRLADVIGNVNRSLASGELPRSADLTSSGERRENERPSRISSSIYSQNLSQIENFVPTLEESENILPPYFSERFCLEKYFAEEYDKKPEKE